MRGRFLWKLIGILLAVALAAAACGNDDEDVSDVGGSDRPAASASPAPEPDDTSVPEPDDTPAPEPDDTSVPEPDDAPVPTPDDTPVPEPGTDYEALGLWDDGPCDASLAPLVVSLQTVFASPVLTLVDQAQALEAAAEAFNQRGGANGHCIEVHTCDDNADPNKALECVRDLDREGVAVTINDTVVAGAVDVGPAYADAGIPRFAISPQTVDYGDMNSYPFDAGGAGTSIMMPQGLLDQGITTMGTVRVDLAAAAQLTAIFPMVFGPRGAEFVADLPVPGGTTDYSQFILSAERAGAEGLVIPLGGQEAIQLLDAAKDLGSELLVSGSLGTFPYVDIAGLGDFASQIILNAAIPPATFDHPVVKVLADDLAASGVEALQTENLKSSPMRSWVGLYALLYIIRESGTTDFSRENLKALIDAAEEIPMIGLMPTTWTPSAINPGQFPRSGTGSYSFWVWDPEAEWNGNQGNFVLGSEASFIDAMCGTPFGAPPPC